MTKAPLSLTLTSAQIGHLDVGAFVRSLNAAQISREWPLHLSDLFGGGGTHDSGGISPRCSLPLCLTECLSVWRLCERVRARGEGGDREKREADI